MYKNKYTYPELVRVEKNDVRYYRDSKENLVPSVTTILSATGDKSGIDAWKRRVGPKAARAVVDEATTIGTAVHLAIENYLYGNCLLYTSPSPRDATLSRMPSSA